MKLSKYLGIGISAPRLVATNQHSSLRITSLFCACFSRTLFARRRSRCYLQQWTAIVINRYQHQASWRRSRMTVKRHRSVSGGIVSRNAWRIIIKQSGIIWCIMDDQRRMWFAARRIFLTNNTHSLSNLARTVAYSIISMYQRNDIIRQIISVVVANGVSISVQLSPTLLRHNAHHRIIAHYQRISTWRNM